MAEEKQDDVLFAIYQSMLAWVDCRRDPETAKFYKETPEAWKHGKEVVFRMYQQVRQFYENPLPSVDRLVDREQADKIPPYVENGTEFRCEGVLKYRGRQYPVYLDDYGMRSFIMVNGRTIEVDSFGGETDWYSELDRIIDKIDG